MGGSFALQISGAAPGDAGTLAFSLNEQPRPLAAYGVTVYPAPPYILTPFLLDGQGISPRLMERTPLEPSLLGVQAVAQAVVSSAGGPEFSNGLRLRIGISPIHPFPSLASDFGDAIDVATTGDMNGDGILDLVTVDSALGRVHVGLGDGTGRFIPFQTRTVPPGAAAAALGDFNGDSNLDLAFTTGVFARLLRVQLGSPSGALGPPLSFPAGGDPGELVVGDFDADDLDDLAVANPGTQDLWIYHDWPGGGFDTPGTVLLTMDPLDVETLDYNEDGILDLAATTGTVVTTLHGLGDGTFQADLLYAFTSNPPLEYLTRGDLDGDGHDDLLVTLRTSGIGEIFTILGTGSKNLTFGATSFFGPPGLGKPLVGDLDEDGILDVLVARGSQQYEVGFGLGDSSFLPPTSYALGANLVDPVLRDFDGDGRRDLVGGHANSQLAVFYRGLEDGLFPKLTRIEDQSAPLSAVTADFDSDGVPDLAIVNKTETSVSIQLGDGEGGFVDAGSAVAGDGLRAIATGDLNGDGTEDLVVPDVFGLALLFGDGNGGFAPAVPVAVGGTTNAVSLGDLDEDGSLDVILARAGPNGIGILLGLGDGGLAPPTFLVTGANISDLVVTDLDGDGHLDIAALTGSISVYYGDGTGAFPSAIGKVLPSNGRSITSADFDEDGVPDLAVALSTTDQLATLRGSGGRAFDAPVLIATGTDPRPIRAADFDGDGHVDLLAGNASPLPGTIGGRTVSAHVGHGDGTFGPLRLFATPTVGGVVDILTADFDLDGEQDLVAVDPGLPTSSVPGSVLVLFGLAGD